MRFTDKSMEQHQLLIQWSEGQFTPLALSAATTSREKSRRSRGKESKMTSQNTIEENKRIVRAFIETAFNQHQADRAADYLTPDMQWHGGTLGTVEDRLGPPGPAQRRAGHHRGTGYRGRARGRRGNAQGRPPRDSRVGQTRPVGCGRRVPRGGRKDRRGVGGRRPACFRLRGWGLHSSLALLTAPNITAICTRSVMKRPTMRCQRLMRLLIIRQRVVLLLPVSPVGH